MTITALTTAEIRELEQREQQIQRGIDTFFQVGLHLKEIRDKRLYRQEYGTFEEYCRKRWGFSRSNGYNLISAGEIARNVGIDPSAPVTKSHLEPLKLIKDETVQQKAWQEAQEAGAETADEVKNICKKHVVLSKAGEPWVSAVKKQKILGHTAYDLLKQLKRLPAYYKTAVENFCVSEGGIPTETLEALRTMEWSFQQEALDILNAGGLDNGYEWIELHNLSPQAVNAYKARLEKEQIVTQQLEVKKKQAEQEPQIIDGSDVFDLPKASGDRLFYLFPEGLVGTTQLAKHLEENGYNVMMIVAYSGRPEIRFDRWNTVPVTSINGNKPQPVIRLIKELA